MERVARPDRLPATTAHHGAFYAFLFAFGFLLELNVGGLHLPDVVAFVLFAAGGHLLVDLDPRARRILPWAWAGAAVSGVALVWSWVSPSAAAFGPGGAPSLLGWSLIILQVGLAAAVVWEVCQVIASMAKRLQDRSTRTSARARGWGYVLFAAGEAALFVAAVLDPGLMGLVALLYVGLFLFVTLAMVDLVFQGERLLGTPN